MSRRSLRCVLLTMTEASASAVAGAGATDDLLVGRAVGVRVDGQQNRAARRAERTHLGRGKRLVPLLTGALVLALGAFAGTAYAYFSATATGTGDAHVGTLVPVGAQATVSTTLYPGTKGTLHLALTNSNSFAVTVLGVSQDGPVTVSGGGPGCTSGITTTPGTSGVTVPMQTLTLTLTPGPHSFTVATGVTMSITSNTTCQGATFHIPVTVTVKS